MARKGKGVEIPIYLNIDDAVTTADSLGKKIDDALNKHQNTENPQIAQILKGLKSVDDAIKATRGYMDSLKFDPLTGQSIDALTEKMEHYRQKMLASRQELSEFRDHLKEYLPNVLAQIDSYGAERAAKRYFGANKDSDNRKIIEEYIEIQNAANQAQHSMDMFGQALDRIKGQTDDDAMSGIAKNLNRSTDRAEILLLKLAQLEKQNEKLNNSGKSGGSFKQNFYIVRTLVNDISKGIQNLQGKIKNFTSGITNLAKRMLHLNKESRKTTGSLKDGFRNALRNVMRYGLGIRSLFFLFRRLRKYALEALGEMSKAFPEVNNQMSRAVTALNQMKGAIGTAIQPLLNVVVPVLEKVAALISKIMNLIGGVFATLTGQGKIYTAVATQTDYAASLEKTGKAAKDAKKELEGYLSPIDEINKYQSKKDDEDKDSGGGASGPGYSYVETPISDLAKKIADIINEIMRPIKEAWARVGDYVKQAWTRAFESVKKLASDIGRDFLKVWNQEATIKMWENIFRIVANIGSVIHYIAKNLDDAWNKNNVGLHILEKIRDICAIVVQHILNMSRYTVDWAKNLNFSPLLEGVDVWLESFKRVVDNVAGIFEDFYVTVLLPLSKWTIEEGLPKVIDIFRRFNDEVQWEVIRARLQRVWDALRPFAIKVGEGLIIFIQDCANALRNFFNSKAWDWFIDTLIKWMNDVEPEDVARTIKLVAGAIVVLKGALFALTGIKTLNTTVTAIKTFLNLFGAGVGGAGAAGAGGVPTAVKNMKDLKGGIVDLTGALENWNTVTAGLAGTYLFADIFKIFTSSSDLKRLKQQLDEGTISAKEFNEAIDKLHPTKRGEATTYLLDRYAEDAKKLKDALDSGSITMQEYRHEMSNLRVEYGRYNQAQEDFNNKYQAFLRNIKNSTRDHRDLNNAMDTGGKSLGKYQELLDKTNERLGRTSESSKHLSTNIKAGAANISTTVADTGKNTSSTFNAIKACVTNMTSSVAKDNDKMNKSFDDVKTKTTYTAQTVTSEVYNAGFKMGGTIQTLEKTVNTNNTKINKSVDDMSNNVKKDANEAKTEFDKSMNDMSKSVTDNTNIIKDKTNEIKTAFDKDKWTFSGVTDGLGATFKSALSVVRDYWNPLADSLSGQHTIFGKTFSINLPKIPPLAQGAVIPPNREFLALLGDQKSGTNIETPLSTMVEAFNTALRQNGGTGGVHTINFLLPDRRKIASYAIEGGRIIQTSTGRNPFELA